MGERISVNKGRKKLIKEADTLQLTEKITKFEKDAESN